MGLLAEVATDAARALRAVEANAELIEADRVAEAARLLREIIGQEFDVGDDELPRARRGRGVRQIVSAHDPDMRHGRKGSHDTDLQAQSEPADDERRAGRPVRARTLRAMPTESVVRPEREHLYRTPTTDRTTARTHRPPLPRTQETLPRSSKIRSPDRLDRRSGQPPPDRSRPAGPDRINGTGPSPEERQRRKPDWPDRESTTHHAALFSGLIEQQH
jgi:hypothetical protein